jgi:serine/threonine protein kinase
MFLRISQPLAFAHARGVAHYDLKPANIMVGEFGEVLVLDWAAPGRGTPQFMPPEQVTGSEVGPRADVFALGRILGILLQTGTRVPRPLRSIQHKATEFDQTLRYDGAQALAADITAWMDGMPVRAHNESITERLARLLRKHRALAGLLAAYLLLRIVLLFWFRR